MSFAGLGRVTARAWSRSILRSKAIVVVPAPSSPSLLMAYSSRNTSSYSYVRSLGVASAASCGRYLGVGRITSVRAFASNEANGSNSTPEDSFADRVQQEWDPKDPSGYEDSTLDSMYASMFGPEARKDGPYTDAVFWHQFLESPVFLIGSIDGLPTDESKVKGIVSTGNEEINYASTTHNGKTYVPVFTKQERLQEFSPLSKMPFVVLPGSVIIEMLLRGETQEIALVVNPGSANESENTVALTLDRDPMQYLLDYHMETRQGQGVSEGEGSGGSGSSSSGSGSINLPGRNPSLDLTPPSRDTRVIEAALGSYFSQLGHGVKSAYFLEVEFNSVIENAPEVSSKNLIIAMHLDTDAEGGLRKILEEVSTIQLPATSDYQAQDLMFIDLSPTNGNVQISNYIDANKMQPWYKQGEWKMPDGLNFGQAPASS